MSDVSSEVRPAAKGVVLDSSILIELLRSNRVVQSAIDRLLDSGYDYRHFNRMRV